MKRQLHSAGAVLLAVGLAACAAPPNEPQQLAQADGPQADVVCFFEAPTGTNRKIRRCMSREEYNKAVDSAQRLGNEIKVPPPPPQ